MVSVPGKWLLSLLILIPAGAFLAVQEEKDKATIVPQEGWATFFAEKKVELHFSVKVARGFAGKAVWVFSAENQRVLPAGRGEAAIKADKDQATFTVPLAMPAVKDGVVLPANLEVTVSADGQEKAVARYEKKVWIYPPDPFFERKKWLEDLKITLYDPDPKGKTAAMLKELQVPFEEVRNVAALGEHKEGLVLIGEGVSFKDDPGLGEVLVQAAARGVPVLCLAPAAGSLTLPGTDDNLHAPNSLTFHRQDVIARLDKRLDAAAWAPDNQAVASSLNLKAEEGKVVAEVLPGPKAWPWVQIDFPDKKGRLIICGFAPVAKWEASPTPRFLLARLFEHVTSWNDK